MMKQCNKCPGIIKSHDYLTEVFHDDDGDEVIVSYKYWSDEGPGFTSLTDRHAPCDDFIEKLILKIDDLTSNIPSKIKRGSSTQ